MRPSLAQLLKETEPPRVCTVCHEVSPEVRALIDSARGKRGPTAVAEFLRRRGLWKRSEMPIRSHWRRHLK